MLQPFKTFLETLNSIILAAKRKDHINPQGNELRQLTVEWLQQPKMQTYLYLQRSFLAAKKNDYQTPSLINKLRVSLAYELCLIQYASGYRTNQLSHLDPGTPETNLSFFPHRLSFLSYWLLGFAAVLTAKTSGVSAFAKASSGSSNQLPQLSQNAHTSGRLADGSDSSFSGSWVAYIQSDLTSSFAKEDKIGDFNALQFLLFDVKQAKRQTNNIETVDLKTPFKFNTEGDSGLISMEPVVGQLPNFTAPWYPVTSPAGESVNSRDLMGSPPALLFPLNVFANVTDVRSQDGSRFPSRMCAAPKVPHLRCEGKTSADSLWVQPQIDYKPEGVTLSVHAKLAATMLAAVEEKAPSLVQQNAASNEGVGMNIANNYLWAVQLPYKHQIQILPEGRTFITDPVSSSSANRSQANAKGVPVCSQGSSADVEKDPNLAAKAGGEAVSLYRSSVAYTDAWYKKILVENAHLTGVVDLWLKLPTLQLEYASTLYYPSIMEAGSKSATSLLAEKKEVNEITEVSRFADGSDAINDKVTVAAKGVKQPAHTSTMWSSQITSSSANVSNVLSAPTQPIRLKHPLWMCDLEPGRSTQTDKLFHPQSGQKVSSSLTNSARALAKNTLCKPSLNSVSNNIWASDDQSRTPSVQAAIEQSWRAYDKKLTVQHIVDVRPSLAHLLHTVSSANRSHHQRFEKGGTEGNTYGARFANDPHSWRLWAIRSAEKGDKSFLQTLISSPDDQNNISFGCKNETWKQPIHPDRRRLEKLFRAFFEKSAIPVAQKNKGRSEADGMFNLTRVRERLRTTSLTHTMGALNSNGELATNKQSRIDPTYLLHISDVRKRRSYTPRVTAMTLLNHRHLLSLGGSNQVVSSDKESAFYDNETIMRLRDRLEMKADRRDRKESLQTRMRSKRKRWYPRPAWIRSQYLRSFWHVRHPKASLLNRKIVTSDLFAEDKQSFLSTKWMRFGCDRLYRSAANVVPLRKGNSSSLAANNLTIPDPIYFGFSKHTEKVLRQYRLWKDGYRQRLLQNWTALYQSQKRHIIHQLTHQALPLAVSGHHTVGVQGLPVPGETSKLLPSWYTTFRGSFGNAAENDFAPFMVSASPQSFSSKWSHALSNAEYNRLVYERVQYRIRKLVETNVSGFGSQTDDGNAGATSEVNVGRKVPGLVRAKNPSNWFTSFWPAASRFAKQELTWLPLDQTNSIWTLQRAWAMHQVQEPSVHIMMKPKNKLATAEKQLPKRKSILNVHSELWQYEQRRSQRKKSKSKMLWSKLAALKFAPLAEKFAKTKVFPTGSEPFLVESTQPWRTKLTRVHTKLNRLMGVRSATSVRSARSFLPIFAQPGLSQVVSKTGGTEGNTYGASDGLTRYIGPGAKFWWVDIPGWRYSWDMNGFPTLRWQSLESANFNSEAAHRRCADQILTQDTSIQKGLIPVAQTMGLALFHVCALFSICSLPSVRDLLKFHAALLYKLMDLCSPFVDLVQKLVCDKLPLWWSARKHIFSQASVGLWRLFWDIRSVRHHTVGVQQPTFDAPLYAGVESRVGQQSNDSRTAGVTFGAANEVSATTDYSLWNKESYRSHFYQAFSLALSRFPSRVKSHVWFKIKYTAWQLTQWSFVQADKIFQQNVKFFTDPVPVTLDFIAYAFFFHWTVDPVHVVPEALDRRLNLSYRRQSRGIVAATMVGPWFMMGAAQLWIGATGSWLQRRVWSFAENWWYLINQLDSDLLRRKQASRRWWDVWVEVLLAAGEHFGTTFAVNNQSPEAEEDQKRLLTALSQDTQWSWFDTTRLPPAPQYQSILTWPDDLSRMWGSQPQIVAPVQNLEAWMEAPPAKSVRSLPVASATAPLLPIAGEIICDVFAGLWERRVAKNILVVGPPGPAKSLWVRALAGEMEVPLIHDSAWAYVNVDGNAPAGIQRLKQVFDSVAWHTPCLFLLEDIHAIGRRRSESLSSRETPRETTPGILMDSAHASYEQQHEKHVFSRDAMTHYRRPVLGDFNKGVATYDFCYELFDPRFPVSLRRQNTTPVPAFRMSHSIYRPLLSRLQHFKGVKNSMSSVGSRAMPAWQMIAQKQQNLRPIHPRQRVLGQPLLGLTEVQEQGLQMNRTRYVIRAKVSWLTQQIFESVSQQLNTLNELLFILDSVRSQRGFAVLATTHVPEMLDPALRRPGRMDQTIHLDLKLGQWELFTSQRNFLLCSQVDKLNPVTALSPNWMKHTTEGIKDQAHGLAPQVLPSVPSTMCWEGVLGLPAKSVVFGQVAERFMQLYTFASHAQQQSGAVDWLFMGSYQIPRQVMPKLAFHVGQTFALSASRRQPSFLGFIANRPGTSTMWGNRRSEAASYAAAATRDRSISNGSISNTGDLYQNLACWIDKRGLLAPRIWTTRLFELQNQKSLADPAGPPHTYVTLPAKRYEHYKRIERDFQRPAGFGWKNKLSLQQNVRVGLRLYGATSGATYQPFFRSETRSPANELSTLGLFLPTTQAAPKGLTSFASAFWQLENLPLQTGTRSAIQKYVNRRLFERHSAYLTNQWWNSHWPEHTAEATEEYWDIRYVEQLGEDMYVDFPEPEQYYVPRERRWMLRNNSWQYPEQWANGWRDHFRQHAVLESYHACYAWLDQRREAFDALSWTYVQQGWINDLAVWNTSKHFEHVNSQF